MTFEAVKDFLAGSAGCFAALFASVWATHGSEHSFQSNVIAAVVLLALLAAILNEFMGRISPRPVSTQAEAPSSFAPRRAAFYVFGLFIFGSVVAGIGVL